MKYGQLNLAKKKLLKSQHQIHNSLRLVLLQVICWISVEDDLALRYVNREVGVALAMASGA